MLAFGMPGIPEIILILVFGVIVLTPIGIIAVVVWLIIGTTKTQSNPNLTTCRGCGNAISIHAESCPQCGCPTKFPD